MATLKNNWLRAGITLTVVLFGLFLVVKAMERDKNSLISKKQPTQKTWYYQLNSTSPTDINNPANYTLTKPANAGNCGVPLATIVCSIKASENSLGQPEFSHGDVTSNPLSYERTLRMPATP